MERRFLTCWTKNIVKIPGPARSRLRGPPGRTFSCTCGMLEASTASQLPETTRPTMSLTGTAVESAMMTALKSQPKAIIYPDYKPSMDFPLWITGLCAKIRAAHAFKLTETDKVQAEVIRSIAGKLAVGTALDTYNRLTEEEKASYDQMVARLTEEFTDPSDKLEFRKKLDYNKRKKDQKLKDFMQEIKRDMTRYSGVPDKILVAGGGTEENPEKERQGVRRFKAGLRTKTGRRSASLNQHMDYHLQEDSELTWTNAIKVATRWEMAQGDADIAEVSEASEEEGEEGACSESLKAMETKLKKTSTKAKTDMTVLSAITDNQKTISAIADQVHENQMKIKGIETSQDKLSTAIEKLTLSNNSIESKLDTSLNRPNQQQYYLPQPVYQQMPPQPVVYQQMPAQQQPVYQQPNPFQPVYQQPVYQQPVYQQPAYNALQTTQQFSQPQIQQQPRFRSPAPATAQSSQFQRGNPAFRARPRYVTFQARTNQPTQGNYGLLRRTPATYPVATAAAPTAAPAAAAAPPAAAAAVVTAVAPVAANAPIAAVEEAEAPIQDPAGAEGQTYAVVPYPDYVAYAQQNGYEIQEQDQVGMVEQWNFA